MEPKLRALSPRARNLLVGGILVATIVLLTVLSGSAKAFTTETGIGYGTGAEANPNLKQLDIYRPDGAAAGDLRPVVVYAHGGGWMIGDKKNKMAFKPKLFTDAGYVFVSINYRLSPDITDSPGTPDFDPNRIRYPEHPRDVAEAIAWVSRNIGAYGGDPDALLLIGHSAGAHLVSLIGTNPAWLTGVGASLKQVLGVVPLDAGAFDVVDSAVQTGANPTANNYVIWNAFGTPAEEAAMPLWREASSLTWADSTDPRHLLVTQASRLPRIQDNQKMADALGQDPLEVFKSPLSHEGINDVVGDPADSTGETAAVMNFLAVQVDRRIDPTVKVLKRPARTVRIGRKVKTRKVAFKFLASGATAGVQCRLDGARFTTCKSPHSFRVKRGKHTLRMRALFPSGRAGVEKVVKFNVVRKQRSRR